MENRHHTVAQALHDASAGVANDLAARPFEFCHTKVRLRTAHSAPATLWTRRRP
jgi:hypothetical protein